MSTPAPSTTLEIIPSDLGIAHIKVLLYTVVTL